MGSNFLCSRDPACGMLLKSQQREEGGDGEADELTEDKICSGVELTRESPVSRPH